MAALPLPMDGPAGARPKKPRRWGASCLECRRRKKGCEGRDDFGNSMCTYCPTFGLPCLFQKQTEPSRIKELEERVDVMQEFLRDLAEASPTDAQLKLQDWLHNPEGALETRPLGRKRKRKTDSDSSAAGSHQSSGSTGPLPMSRGDKGSASRMRALLDAAGFDLARRALVRTADGEPNGEENGLHPAPSVDPSLALNNSDWVPPMDFDHPVSYEACREMLDLYFCWWNPRWNIIDRDLLEESLRRGDDTYCTPFLLVSIFSVVAPHSYSCHDRMDEFGARGHYLFGQELHSQKPRLTTVQGLLTLAAFTSDKTRHSQCYNFVGFAIRMLEDMDLAIEDESQMSPIQRQLRQRCYWHAFACDKMVSLTMSRPPTLAPRICPSLPEIDPAIDARTWLPVRHTRQQPHRPQVDVPQPSYESSCWRYCCEANVFFDEVMRSIYAQRPAHPAESKAFILSMRSRIGDWQAQLPPHIYLTLDEPPVLCPPAHLIYFNITIRVVLLLLFKPFMNRPEVGIPGLEQECARLAEDTHMLFRLYGSNFPPSLSTINVLHVFAAFSAAHIDLLRLRDDRVPPAERGIILERIAFTARLLSEGVGLRSSMGPCLAKLQAQQDAVLNEHRGRYDPVRDHREDLQSLQPQMIPHSTQTMPPILDTIDFSSLSEGLFAESVAWPAFQQDGDVSRVFTELQNFAEINHHY